MITDTTRLRSAYAELVRQRTPRDRKGCPPPERIASVVERAGSETERLETLDHVLACAQCRRELDLLRTASEAATGAAPAVSRVSRFRIGTMIALAASLLLTVVVMSSRNRGADTPGVVRGDGPVELLAPTPLASGGIQLTWRAIPSVSRYEVRVLDEDGRRLVDTTTVDTTLALSDSLVRASHPRVWSLGAQLQDGSSIGPRSAAIR
jgi:hypothetical protein